MSSGARRITVLRPAVVFSDGAAQPRVAVVVHSNILGAVRARIDTYEADLEAAGFTAVRVVYADGSAADVRDVLKGLYDEAGALAGAVLVGNIPHIIYEQMQDWDGEGGAPAQYEDYPCDLFYMDLDGTWTDCTSNGLVQPANGKYDTRAGNLDLEIWVCRIKTDTLPAQGGEAALVAGYFEKNHRYRSKELATERRALVYNDDDWACIAGADAANASMLYESSAITIVASNEQTTVPDYKQNGMAASYELVSLRSHGYYAGHGFYSDDRSQFGFVYPADYRALQPRALFYSLFVCSGADFTRDNYLAGSISMNSGDAGLVCWGSTKTGGMFNEFPFYQELSMQTVVGEAFRQWFNYMQATLDQPTCETWLYGMALIGDAAAIPAAHTPEPAAGILASAGMVLVRRRMARG
ncbi:hypothetical protein GX586_04180 [bacterium]|nr:hypothetical protein [bacterium]